MDADCVFTGQVSESKAVSSFFQAALGPTLGPSWCASAETDKSPNPIRVNGPSLFVPHP